MHRLRGFSTIEVRAVYSKCVKIIVTETKCVLAHFFDVLEDQKPADAFDFISKGRMQAGTASLE